MSVAAIQEVTIRSWSEFVHAVEPGATRLPGEEPYFFRGQLADKSLLPSLARHATRWGLTAEDTLTIEREAISEFRLQAHLYFPAAMIPDLGDLPGWSVLMQHHGVPTRLLDWTASPFVAAYFAVVEHPDEDGVVWMVHVKTITQYMEDTYASYTYPTDRAKLADALSGGADPVVYFVGLELHTERMAAQQTRFSFSYQVLCDHKEAVAASVGLSPLGSHRRIIIPKELKPEFLRRLHLMNITARALFPGIDGFGRSVKELVEVRCCFRGTTS